MIAKIFARIVAVAAALTLLTTSAQAQSSKSLDAKQLDAIWAALIETDDAATKSMPDTIRTLTATPQLVVPYFKQRLKTIPAPDAKKIDQLLADLDSPNGQVRERATRDLEMIGYLAVPALERKLAEKLSLESQRRIEMLLPKIDRNVLSGDELRAVRAIEVLTRIGTPEASAILQELSKGAEAAVQTEHAKRAVKLIGARGK
jgi:hypothetical protein